jgi:hypothetical protein
VIAGGQCRGEAPEGARASDSGAQPRLKHRQAATSVGVARTWLACAFRRFARILLTLAALGFSAITIMADLNKTHASNPLWTPHARFHVVWQVLSYSGIGLIALYLICAGGPMQTERLYLAAALAVAVYGGSFGAVFSRPVYGDGLFDANGYPSFQAPIGPKTWLWDVNVTIFTLTSVILLAGIVAVVAR